MTSGIGWDFVARYVPRAAGNGGMQCVDGWVLGEYGGEKWREGEGPTQP